MKPEQDEFWFARSMVAVDEPINLHKVRFGSIGNGTIPRFYRHPGRFHWLKDGLYRVDTRVDRFGKRKHNGICAGFMVREGKIVRCAPVLRRNIHAYVRRAEFICEI